MTMIFWKSWMAAQAGLGIGSTLPPEATCQKTWKISRSGYKNTTLLGYRHYFAGILSVQGSQNGMMRNHTDIHKGDGLPAPLFQHISLYVFALACT